jgi:hypothetical protein
MDREERRAPVVAIAASGISIRHACSYVWTVVVVPPPVFAIAPDSAPSKGRRRIGAGGFGTQWRRRFVRRRRRT